MIYLLFVMFWVALSFLTWNYAPLGFLWKLKIVLTEFGFWLGLLTLTLIPISWFSLPENTRSFAMLGLLVAAVNLFGPTFQALHVARRHDLPSWFVREQARAASTVSPPQKATHVYTRTADGQNLELDLWRPSSAATGSLLIVIHGGSWRGGVRQDMEWMNHKLALRGHTVASISYRLGTEGRFPAPMVDATAAIEWLWQRADEIGFRRDDISLLGRSAGGQIALVTAYSHPKIRRVVGIYSPTDMLWGWENSKPWHIIDGKAVIEGYLGGPPAQVPAQYHHASAVNLVRPTSPPTLLLHGTRDELAGFEHTRRLRASLEASRVPHEIIELPWATHGFDWFSAGPGASILLEAIDRFLRR